MNPVKRPLSALVEALCLMSHRSSNFSPFLIGLSLLYGSIRSIKTTVIHDGSVESLSRVLLLLLIDHYTDDEAAYAAEHAEEKKEEEL